MEVYKPNFFVIFYKYYIIKLKKDSIFITFKRHKKNVKKLLSVKGIKISEAQIYMGEIVLYLAVQNSHESCPNIIGALMKHANNIEVTTDFKINEIM